MAKQGAKSEHISLKAICERWATKL